MSHRHRPRGAAEELRDALSSCPLLPILRASDARRVVSAARALIDAEVRVIELTATTSGAFQALREIDEQRDDDDLFIGMGTITSEELATAAHEAGADFLATPSTSPHLAPRVDLPLIRGAWTPSEVQAAWAHKPALIKLFPAASGGVRHLSALREVFAEIPFLPTGGITADDAADYLAAGAVGVGLGGGLTGPALAGLSPSRQLTDDARRLLQRLKVASDGAKKP